jgi:hypothetical protein
VFKKLSKRKAKENVGQCKSKDETKSYANAVFRHGCYRVSASLRTGTLREIKKRDFKE